MCSSLAGARVAGQCRPAECGQLRTCRSRGLCYAPRAARAIFTDTLLSGRSRMSNARILVVDDDQVIQQLLKVNLELEGYTVEVASDGEEALVLFDRFHPDLVLLDIMMPKLDGWEVARRLAKTTGGAGAGGLPSGRPPRTRAPQAPRRRCSLPSPGRPEPRNPTSRRPTPSGSPPT